MAVAGRDPTGGHMPGFGPSGSGVMPAGMDPSKWLGFSAGQLAKEQKQQYLRWMEQQYLQGAGTLKGISPYGTGDNSATSREGRGAQIAQEARVDALRSKLGMDKMDPNEKEAFNYKSVVDPSRNTATDQQALKMLQAQADTLSAKDRAAELKDVLAERSALPQTIRQNYTDAAKRAGTYSDTDQFKSGLDDEVKYGVRGATEELDQDAEKLGWKRPTETFAGFPDTTGGGGNAPGTPSSGAHPLPAQLAPPISPLAQFNGTSLAGMTDAERMAALMRSAPDMTNPLSFNLPGVSTAPPPGTGVFNTLNGTSINHPSLLSGNANMNLGSSPLPSPTPPTGSNMFQPSTAPTSATRPMGVAQTSPTQTTNLSGTSNGTTAPASIGHQAPTAPTPNNNPTPASSGSTNAGSASTPSSNASATGQAAASGNNPGRGHGDSPDVPFADSAASTSGSGLVSGSNSRLGPAARIKAIQTARSM
jgi:hypothetical protein